MRAASARAISSHRNPATQHGLERAVAWSRQWSAEFPFFLANHLPMVLVALHRMGASDERLEAYCQIYRAQNGLVPVPEPVGRDHARTIGASSWASASAKATIGRSSPAKSRGSAQRRRPSATCLQLMPGIAASALHAFMRMAYATMTDSDEETGVALGYWAATYLSLGASQGARRRPTIRPRFSPSCTGRPTFRQVETERDLLWHFMRAVALKARIRARRRHAWRSVRRRHDRVARCSLALYAATARLLCAARRDRNALARLIAPRTPDRADAAALFLAGDRVARAEDRLSRPAERRAARSLAAHALPDWPEIFREAVTRDDEHDLSLSLLGWRRIQALWRPALSDMPRRSG